MSLIFSIRYAGLLSLITFILSSCTINHTSQLTSKTLSELKVVDQIKVHRNAQWALHQSSSVYLAYPISQVPSESDYPRFRKDLAEWHERQAKSFFQTVKSASVSESLEESRRKALVSGAELLLVLKMEQNNNRLSSFGDVTQATKLGAEKDAVGRDTLFLRLHIVDVRTQRLLDTVSIRSQSGWFYWSARDSKKLVNHALQSAYASLLLSPQHYSLSYY